MAGTVGKRTVCILLECFLVPIKFPLLRSFTVNELETRSVLPYFLLLCSVIEHTSGEDHEFLHGQFVSGVRSTVDDVKCWNRKYDVLISGEISDVTVKWYTLQEKTQRFLMYKKYFI